MDGGMEGVWQMNMDMHNGSWAQGYSVTKVINLGNAFTAL